MMHTKNNPGYILLLSMVMIAAALAVGAYVFSRGVVMIPFSRTMINRQKAKMIALGGVQVAIAQLAQPVAKQKEKKEEKKTKLNEEQEKKLFLARLLPVLNRWQQFTLKPATEGVYGTMQICITSEEGKIPLNKIYDFDTHKFKGDRQVKGDWKKFIKVVCSRIEERMQTSNLFSAFEKFLKKQQYKLNDVTELLVQDEFAVFKNYMVYEPQQDKQRPVAQKKEPLYLMDIFSVASTQDTIEPWLLSDSLRTLLGIQPLAAQERAQVTPKVAQWLKPFKQQANWAKDFKTRLQPVYAKELHSLPKDIESILNSTFAPKVFSVLSYGTVQGLTQRLLAIVERMRYVHKEKPSYDVVIKKMYWL